MIPRILIILFLLRGLSFALAWITPFAVSNLKRHYYTQYSSTVSSTLSLSTQQSLLSVTKGDLPSIETKQSPIISTISPKHVAFICDGNARWAQQRNQSAVFGHRQGAQRLIDTLPVLRQHNVQCCTMFAFSTENWNRSPLEIREVFRVMEQTANDFYETACQEDICIRILGNLEDERIPASLVQILQRLQIDTRNTETSSQTTFILNLAVNYGGRQDLVQAAQQLARQVQSGTLQPDDITEDSLASVLSTQHLPDPDLIIRTSGEYRLSNFLLWNAAYAELYFTDLLWPDFDQEQLEIALEWYAERQRRFGGRSLVSVKS